MSFILKNIRLLLVLTALPVLGGCWAAAAGAGAAAGIAYTDRGAESQVNAPLNQVVSATEAVFANMGIAITEREIEEAGTEVELKGQKGDTEVNIEIERDNDRTTRVHVTAKENVVEYDPDYAKDILLRIIEQVDE